MSGFGGFGGASNPTGAFSFGSPAAAPTTTAPGAAPTPAIGGFSFGASKPASSTGSGFSFGAAPAATPAATGFSFGTTPTATTTAPPPAFGASTTPSSSFSFGGAPSGGATSNLTAPAPSSLSITTGAAKPLSFGAPAAGSTTSAAPAQGFTSLTGISTAATTTAPAPTLGTLSTQPSAPSLGFSFGSAGSTTAAVSIAASVPAPTAIATPLGGGFSLTAPATTATTAPATSTSSAPTLNFGAANLSSATATTSASAITTTTAPPASTGFSLGSLSSGGVSSLGGGLSKVVPPAANTTQTTLPTSLSTSTTTTSSATAASMSYRQLEEAINKWTLELEEQEKVFLNQATQVNAWDRLLMSNGEKIVKLHESVEKVKLDQQRLEHELDFVKSQQLELDEILRPLEESLSDSAPPPDAERERIYSLAENLDAQLQRMGDDLREIIEHLNSANRNTNDQDPIVQISRVLNAHMDALQWVDQTSGVVQKKLDEVTKIQDIRRKESERIGLL